MVLISGSQSAQQHIPCCCLLQSAKGLFEHHTVDNLVMEYTPGAWEGNQKWDDYPSVPGMLE